MYASALAAALLATSISVPNPVTEKLIEPPFVRKWSILTGDNTKVIGVRSGAIYYSSRKGIFAVSFAMGKPMWSAPEQKSCLDAILDGSRIYAVMGNGEKKGGSLISINTSNGRAANLLELTTPYTKLASSSGRIYLLDGTRTAKAVDPANGRILWSRVLRQEKRADFMVGNMVATSAGIYIGFDGSRGETANSSKKEKTPPCEFGLDPATGAIRWSRSAEYAGLYKPLSFGPNVITRIDHVKMTDMRSGKTIWTGGDADNTPAIIGNVVITYTREKVTGRDGPTGKVLWHIPIHDKDTRFTGMDEPAVLSDGRSAWLYGTPFMCVSRDGREKWRSAKPFTGEAIYADSHTIITNNLERILCYRKGSMPPAPATDSAKQALAKKLTDEYEYLDEREREQLRGLSPHVFPLLLNRYVQWAGRFDSHPDSNDSQFVYGLLTYSPPLLLATFDSTNTPKVVQALTKLGDKSSWRGSLEQILEKKGSQADYIPTLIARLKRNPKEEGSTSLSAVSHSTDPRAVQFMLDALADPKAPSDWRSEAFIHLAGTGGEAGVKAVLEARAKAGSRKPWWELIDLANLSRNDIISTKTDTKNRTWVLFRSGLLGNYSDLFVVEKMGSSWGKPLFTGVWTRRTFNHPEPKEFRGIPIAKLVSTEWIKVFPDDEAIRKDSDGDGLTDVVEARLGTNPNKADTDGDGEPDSTDPCPNAAPQPLDDDHKIIAACIDARFFEQKWNVPATISAGDIKPFELYGYGSTLIWESEKKESPLGAVYGGGMNAIGLSSIEPKRKSGSPITYGPDRKTARMMISRYSGGLNGDGSEVTLKKIGDEWFVVDIQLKYVS